jgi:hypothetical protein
MGYTHADIFEKIHMKLDNISSGAKSACYAPDVIGTIKKAKFAVNGQISVAACTISMSISGVRLLSFSLPTSFSLGSTKTIWLDSANSLLEASTLTLTTDGASTNDVDIEVALDVERQV